MFCAKDNSVVTAISFALLLDPLPKEILELSYNSKVPPTSLGSESPLEILQKYPCATLVSLWKDNSVLTDISSALLLDPLPNPDLDFEGYFRVIL